MKSVRTSALKIAALLGLVMAALPLASTPIVHAAGAASINSVSFQAAVATTYDHTVGGGAWNDGSTAWQKNELQASDYQCGEYASFFTELTTPASPAAGSNFQVEIVQEFTLDTTGQSGVALVPQTTPDHLFVQDGVDPADTAPNPSTPTASINRVGATAPAVVNSGPIFTSGSKAVLTFYVDDVQANQTVIIRTDALIQCDPAGSSPTGNLQAALLSVTALSANSPEAISAGNQTVNFKTVGNLGYSTLVKTVSTDGCTTKSNSIEISASTAVTYCYTVTNFGGSPLINVVVTDDNATPADTSDDFPVVLTGLSDKDSDSNADDLAAGGTATGTYSVPGGFSNGLYTNIAVLTVGGVTKSTADAVVTVAPGPNFLITKQSTSVPTQVGDVITYTITMTNTGDVSLTGATIADPKADLTTCTNSGGGGAVAQSGHTSTSTTIAAGDTWTCTATYTVVAADVTAKQVDNTATGDTDQTPSKTASKTVNLALFTITKESTSVPTQVGDVITYTITMTNTGNISLTGATIADPKADLTTCTNSGGGGAVAQSGHTSTSTTIAAGKTWTCTATYTVVAADVTAKQVDNTATGDTDQTPSKTASKTVNLALFTITKESTSVPTQVGDVITYTITMTNTGNISLTGATIADPKADLTTCTNSGGGGAVAQSGHTSTSTTIAAGDTWTCTATYTVVAADVTAKQVDNTATGDTDQTPSKTASKTVNLALFTITKESTSVPTQVGDVITYTITMTNTGNISLTGATIADPKADLTTCTNSGGGGAVAQSGHTSTSTTIAAGKTWTCTATYTVVAADVTAKQVDNTATGDTDQTPSKTASKTVNLALFTITKESTSVPTQVGDVITYTITMTNTGNISLTGATIADPKADLTTCTNSGGGGAVAQSGHTSTSTTIAAGDTWTCTATHTVTQAEVDAGAIANTASGNTDQTPSKTADKNITVTRSPSFTVTKTDTTTTAPKKAGDIVTYSITVTNTGNTTLVAMTITDANAVIGTCNVPNGSNLAPRATLTCTASHVVTQAEADAGKTENTAVATASGLSAITSNKVTTPITPNPLLSVTLKQITDKKLVVGDKVDYEVIVKNTGNITLKDVTPSVTNFVITSCTPAVPTTLAPGQEIKCVGYHVVTKQDVAFGVIRAKAIASGVSTLDSTTKVPATAPDVEVPLELPTTGSDSTLPASWGALLMFFGVALLFLRRRPA